MLSRRLAVGALLGVIVWTALRAWLPFLPEPIRFLIGWLFFTFGPGVAAGVWITRDLDRLRRVIILLGFGTAAAPIVIDLLGRIDLLAVYPYVALALTGAGLAVWSPRAVRRSGRITWTDGAACVALVTLAVGTGAIVFWHRLTATPDGILLYGHYDSLDLAYYAAITAEASHTVPPTASYYAGHQLNYAYYPQLVLAMVHRFAAVPMLPIYFAYAWPAFLSLGALTAFVLIRSLASTGISLLAVTLMLVGGDFSYLAAWFLPHATFEWDYVLWPTNFLAPTMEVLHFNSWTPSLAVFFTALFAIVFGIQSRARGWTLISALLLAALFQFKPFAYVILMAGIFAAALFSYADTAACRRFAATFGLGTVFVLPFVYRMLALYDDRRSRLLIDFFLLPQRMLIKLDLTEAFEGLADRLAPVAPLRTPLFLFFATAVFLLVGLGVRWVGVPGVWRAVRDHDGPDAPAWRLLGWTTVAGVAIPFVLVTDPYNDTLQFYQTGLYLMWIFTAVGLAASVRAHRLAGSLAVAGAIALTLPSSLHYLELKWTDNQRPPLVRLGRAELDIAEYLQTTDPRQTVILHDRPLDPSLMTVVTERRVVLAWARYAVGSDARRGDVNAFYGSATGDPGAALDILRRYHVTHVIVQAQRDRVHPEVLARLRPLIQSPEVTLYGVPSPSGP